MPPTVLHSQAFLFGKQARSCPPPQCVCASRTPLGPCIHMCMSLDLAEGTAEAPSSTPTAGLATDQRPWYCRPLFRWPLRTPNPFLFSRIRRFPQVGWLTGGLLAVPHSLTHSLPPQKLKVRQPNATISISSCSRTTPMPSRANQHRRPSCAPRAGASTRYLVLYVPSP